MSLVKGGILSQFLLNYDFTKGFPAALTHTRASAATLVDESGNVVQAEANTIPALAFNVYGGMAEDSVVVGGGLDGSDSIRAFTESGGSQCRLQVTSHNVPLSGGRFSIVVKEDATYALPTYIILMASNSPYATFKTSDWSFTATGSPYASATQMGGGWVRLEVEYPCYTGSGASMKIVGSNSTNRFGTLSANRAFNTSQVMFTPALKVQDFLDYGTYAPRITHDKDGNALGYLHEPQGTNLQTLSTPGRSASPWWGETNITFTPNASVSPSGATDAVAVVATAASTTLHYMTRGYTAPSADTVMTMSLYAKAGAVNFLRLALDSSSRAKSVFNLTDGSIVSTGSKHVSSYAEDVGNGWWRCVLVGETSGSGNFIAYAHDDLNGATAWAGDGSATSISVWGAQVEEGTAATSLIPTCGAEATRQADAVADYVVAGLSEVDSFTMLMEYSPLSDARQDIFGITDGGSDSIKWDSQRNASLHYVVDRGDAIGGTSDYDVSRSADVANMRVAFSYSSSLREADVNGGGATKTSSKSMSTSSARGLDRLKFGNTATNTIVKSVRLFGKFKTAAELITLTT